MMTEDERRTTRLMHLKTLLASMEISLNEKGTGNTELEIEIINASADSAQACMPIIKHMIAVNEGNLVESDKASDIRMEFMANAPRIEDAAQRKADLFVEALGLHIHLAAPLASLIREAMIEARKGR